MTLIIYTISHITYFSTSIKYIFSTVTHILSFVVCPFRKGSIQLFRRLNARIQHFFIELLLNHVYYFLYNKSAAYTGYYCIQMKPKYIHPYNSKSNKNVNWIITFSDMCVCLPVWEYFPSIEIRRVSISNINHILLTSVSSFLKSYRFVCSLI